MESTYLTNMSILGRFFDRFQNEVSVSHINEDMVEQEMLGWFEDLGYEVVFGPELAPDGERPERKSYKHVLLEGRLRDALHRLNPGFPAAAIADAVAVLTSAGTPGLMAGNQEFQRRLTRGVQVFWQQDGETRSDRVRLADFANPEQNDWLVVNQFTVIGMTASGSRERRPDVVVFLNGMPVAVFELKNAASEAADVSAAYHQLQTYKDEIAELFRTNEVLVASDGIYARMGSLSADEERFTAWRTIDGKERDPLGQFGELETLVRGVSRKSICWIICATSSSLRTTADWSKRSRPITNFMRCARWSSVC